MSAEARARAREAGDDGTQIREGDEAEGMIESLRLQDIAIVELAELEFGPGLNVLTGETGAGKSIILGALALLVGGRSAPGTLREGAESASIEAIFQTAALPELEADLRARSLISELVAGAEPEAHELIVCRTLSSSGRGRARIGGQLVPIATLGELFGGRIEISSQHSSQTLLRPESHGRMLDVAGGLLEVRAEVRRSYEAVREIDEALAALRAQAEERARRQDFLAFQLAEFDEVGLVPGEIEGVAQEHARLAHAESLRAEGAAAVAALRGDDDAGVAAGAADLLDTALRDVQSMARLDAALSSLVERLAAADAELRDIASDLERYVDGIDGDPQRLARVEDRIAQIERLRRKYGRSESEVLGHRERIAEELAQVKGADSRIRELEVEAARARQALADAARRLSEGRARAARKLCREVESSLRDLGMPDARFAVALEPSANRASLAGGVASGPTGAEAPEFQFSANKGESPRSLQKVASGGELSRVFLAVKNALRAGGANMVLVFDEVDAGIGGRAAERVGRALAELARSNQVLCITHLPQIAAFADVHFTVQKADRKGRTLARVERLEGEARVDEIARMAGGEAISEATRRHARELLKVKSPT